MPNELLIEILQAVATLADGAAPIVSLLESAIGILKTGVVTPEQESAIRAQLDSVKAQIDAA
jgi:hypothetical protein